MTRLLRAGRAAAALTVLSALPRGSAHRTADPFRPVDAKAYAAAIASHRGHVLVVDFWATWCSPCREEMPGVVALAGKYAKDGVQLVTVTADGPGHLRDAERFLDSVGAPPERYVKRTKDDDAFIASVDSAWTGVLPALFVYGRDGRTVRALTGETPADSLAAAVRTALAPGLATGAAREQSPHADSPHTDSPRTTSPPR